MQDTMERTAMFNLSQLQNWSTHTSYNNVYRLSDMNLPEIDRIKTKIFGISEGNEKEINKDTLLTHESFRHVHLLISTNWSKHYGQVQFNNWSSISLKLLLRKWILGSKARFLPGRCPQKLVRQDDVEKTLMGPVKILLTHWR